MELKDVIGKRKSVRKYKNKAVTDKQIKTILESARLAPSGKNRQPWRFVVLRGDRKDAAAQVMLDWAEEHSGEPLVSGVTATAKVIKNAPVLILVYRVINEERWWNSDVLSIGAAVEHMLLTAADIGLGSLWIGVMTYSDVMTDAIGRIAGIDGRFAFSTAVALGYADEEPSPRPRLSLEELILA